MNTNGREFRQQRLELGKYPFSQVFTGRVFQSWNVIQIVMVEPLIERLEDRFDFRKITYPADMGINLAFKVNGNAERVAVQTSAFVPLWDVR
jgi:hypothetical protein